MQSGFWQRAIILVDMNAFFASVEQLDHPELRGKPIAVTNGEQGSCIITCSYEARAYGVKTGMRLKEARQLCPTLIQRPSDPHRYAEVSTNIMEALQCVTPDVEVFSVDEAFLDVTRCQSLLGTPEQIAQLAKQTVFAASGLRCSVGVSGDKTTAKFAAKLNKPDGLTVIPPWQARERLRDVPVTELCGIGKGIGQFLVQYGVVRCGDMARLPISVLARRFGNLGRRIWYMCQGADPEPLHVNVAPPKSIGHGKVVPPNTRDAGTVRTYLLHMSEKVAARLRRHQIEAQHFYVAIRTNAGWLAGKYAATFPTHDGAVIMALCETLLRDAWRGQGIHQIQVTALDPQPQGQQLDLFAGNVAQSERREEVNRVVDAINQRYGEFTVAPGTLLKRSKMPNVIAPAWKPHGHRQTI